MSKNEIGRSWNKKQGNQERHILNSIKSKVIAGFILFALSIGLSWLVVRHTNDAMMVIDKLYSPNYKMKLVDDLFRQIAELEQSQRAKAMENPNLPLEELLVGTKRIRQTLDTLLLCVMDNHNQISRIDSMKNILDKRDELFIQYLKLRSKEIKLDNKMAVSEYLHRLAGRCGHLGAQHLAANLRKLETMTRENTIDSGIYKSITLVISRLEQLNSKLREQIVEQPINKL